jgi:hypothetical protein
MRGLACDSLSRRIAIRRPRLFAAHTDDDRARRDVTSVKNVQQTNVKNSENGEVVCHDGKYLHSDKAPEFQPSRFV